MALSRTPLGGRFGAEVGGVNPSEPLSEALFGDIHRAWLDHAVVLSVASGSTTVVGIFERFDSNGDGAHRAIGATTITTRSRRTASRPGPCFSFGPRPQSPRSACRARRGEACCDPAPGQASPHAYPAQVRRPPPDRCPAPARRNPHPPTLSGSKAHDPHRWLLHSVHPRPLAGSHTGRLVVVHPRRGMRYRLLSLPRQRRCNRRRVPPVAGLASNPPRAADAPDQWGIFNFAA